MEPGTHREDTGRKGRVLGLFLYFFKVGFYTFGGGWSIIAQLQQEYVQKRHWITDEELLDITSVGRSLPGTMIGNVAYLFGHRQAGVLGGIAATVGMVTPPMIILSVLTYCYAMFKDNIWIAKMLTGVRSAVVPIILVAALKLRVGAFPTKACYAIAIVACILNAFLNVNCVLVILLAVAAGLIMGRWKEAEA